MRGLSRMPLAGSGFRPKELGEDARTLCDREGWVETIRSILDCTGYSIARLSTTTGNRYGKGTSYFIPSTFLYKLKQGITPHVCQLAALSQITGYRFVDWMHMCGFDLQQIPRLQLRLHRERTVLITPAQVEGASCFRQSSILNRAGVSSVSYLGEDSRPSPGCRYLFAKIGIDDASIVPKLMRGMIVRIDRHYPHSLRGINNAATESLLWLIELPGGLACSHVKWVHGQRIILLPSRPPWGSWPLRLPNEARILGLVDMRFQASRQVIRQAARSPMRVNQSWFSSDKRQSISFSDLLRVSRLRTGLTFRAAHMLTEEIAHILGDRSYAISLGLLSDYEAAGRLPRHIAKIISLCVIYCIDFQELMETAGLNIDDSSKMPLPMLRASLPFRSEDDTEQYRTVGIGARQAQFTIG